MRNEHFSMRVTPEEKRQLKEVAREYGLSAAAFIRLTVKRLYKKIKQQEEGESNDREAV